MRVLHLLALDRDEGGVLSVIRNIQEASATAGLDLEHVVWVNRRFRETRTPHLDYRYSPWAHGEEPNQPVMAATALPAYLAVRRLLASEHFDVVHAHTRGTLPVAVLLARLGPHPVVFTNHSYASRPWLYRWAADRPGMNTVLLSDDMAAHYGIDPRSPGVELIPACCSDRFFDQPLVGRRTAVGPDRPLRLVGVGMLVDWKGWRTACEAIASLEPEERASLRFDHWGPVADAGLAADLIHLVADAGLEQTIRFNGTTDRMADVLEAADWLLHPAVSDPFPVAVLEALTMGLPVLATSSGGPATMVRAGLSGLHSAPYDTEGLARNLRAALRGDAPVASPGEVRESVRPMSATVVARRYAELYRSLPG